MNSLRSDNLTYNPSQSAINCGKPECQVSVTHVQSYSPYSPESQVLVLQLMASFFFCLLLCLFFIVCLFAYFSLFVYLSVFHCLLFFQLLLVCFCFFLVVCLFLLVVFGHGVGTKYLVLTGDGGMGVVTLSRKNAGFLRGAGH